MNTRIWCQYPKYEKEIKYIEDNLKEYLYDYTFLKEKNNENGHCNFKL